MKQLTVYAIAPSLYCAKLRILLRHKQLDWNEIGPPGGYGSAQYKRVVPSGNMPALVDGDLTLGDSEAIAEYLNEKFQTPAMLPDDLIDRARCRDRSRFHDTRLEPALRRLFAHIGPANRDLAVVNSIGDELNARLDQFGQLLEANPSDPNVLTLGDCGFPISFAWIDALAAPLSLTLSWPGIVSRWRESVVNHTAVQTELNHYLPILDAYVHSTAQVLPQSRS